MTDDVDFDAQLASLREAFRARLPEYQAGLVKARNEFLISGDEGLKEIRRLAHSLAGAAGTFGFQEITELALELETTVDACLAGDPREAVTTPLRHLIREIELSL